MNDIERDKHRMATDNEYRIANGFPALEIPHQTMNDNNDTRYHQWVAESGFGGADTPALRKNYNHGEAPELRVDVPSDDSDV